MPATWEIITPRWCLLCHKYDAIPRPHLGLVTWSSYLYLHAWRGTLPGASGACRGHTASGSPPDASPDSPPLPVGGGFGEMIKSGMV